MPTSGIRSELTPNVPLRRPGLADARRSASRVTISALAVLLTMSAACRHSPAAPTSELSAAEYDVLSAFIAGTFTGPEADERVGHGIVKIVVFNMTQSDDDRFSSDENGRPIPWKERAKSLLIEAPALQQTTADAFRQVNAQPASLHHSFHSPLDYELLDSTQLNSIFKKNGGWPAFYKRYPGSQGILTFSRVGFSADGTQALFYSSNVCGGLCGGGSYVVMQKRNGRWAIGREIEKWVS